MSQVRDCKFVLSDLVCGPVGLCLMDIFYQYLSVCFATWQSPCRMLLQNMKQWNCTAAAVCVPFSSKEEMQTVPKGTEHLDSYRSASCSHKPCCSDGTNNLEFLVPSYAIWASGIWYALNGHIHPLPTDISSVQPVITAIIARKWEFEQVLSQPYSKCFGRFSAAKAVGFFLILTLISSRESLSSLKPDDCDSSQAR